MTNEHCSILTLERGSFSHIASLRLADELGVSKENIEFAESNDDVVKKTVENLGKYVGIVPLETTGGGVVPEVIHALIENLDKKPKICGDYIMPIEQCLAYKSDLSKVRKILTHPQAKLQTKKYVKELKNEYPYIEVETTNSTAEAAYKASRDKTVAAICSILATELYNLPYVVQGIQDSENNETRFIVIGDRDNEVPSGNDRTLLIYEVENVPSALDNAITVFGKRGLNKSIQTSIPTRLRLGKYLMLTEVEAHRNKKEMQDALEEIKSYTKNLYVFGSYPRYNNGNGNSNSKFI